MISSIKEKINQINLWYDHVPEPIRFLYFFFYIILCYIPSFLLVNAGFNNDFIIILPTLLMLPIGIIRYYWCKHGLGK
jgi:hypothetical protein